jgi:hypothetical protein
MAIPYDRPMVGERYRPKYPRDYPALPSGLQPLPYYPNLKRELRSVTGALVLNKDTWEEPVLTCWSLAISSIPH